MTIDLTTLTIEKAHASLKSGEYTVRQLVDAYLAEIERRECGIENARRICGQLYCVGTETIS